MKYCFISLQWTKMKIFNIAWFLIASVALCLGQNFMSALAQVWSHFGLKYPHYSKQGTILFFSRCFMRWNKINLDERKQKGEHDQLVKLLDEKEEEKSTPSALDKDENEE